MTKSHKTFLRIPGSLWFKLPICCQSRFTFLTKFLSEMKMGFAIVYSTELDSVEKTLKQVNR